MPIIQDAATLQASVDTYVYIDVRTKTEVFHTGEEAYRFSHIPGAVFLDMKNDLSGDKDFLPNIDSLTTKLGSLGIDEHTKLVIYDQGNQRAASRAWYVFHYLGHEQVFILQGGFPAWEASGGIVSQEMLHRTACIYTPKFQSEVVTSIQEVKTKLRDDEVILIDSRVKEKYEGVDGSKYHKAGHIPGAVNFHAQNVFSETGLWKTKQELVENFSRLKGEDEIVVSCGSGNSACMNFVALKEAGYEQVSLFAGGFSEWIKDDVNEVVKGKEPKDYEK